MWQYELNCAYRNMTKNESCSTMPQITPNQNGNSVVMQHIFYRNKLQSGRDIELLQIAFPFLRRISSHKSILFMGTIHLLKDVLSLLSAKKYTYEHTTGASRFLESGGVLSYAWVTR